MMKISEVAESIVSKMMKKGLMIERYIVGVGEMAEQAKSDSFLSVADSERLLFRIKK